MIKTLDNAITHLEKAQKDLANTLSTFYSLYEKFKSLLEQLKSDHNQYGDHFKTKVDKAVDQKSGFFSFFIKGDLKKEAANELKEKIKPVQSFYEDTFKTFRQALMGLGRFRSILNKNLETIRLRKTEVSASNADDVTKIRDEIDKSAQALIVKCMEYRRRHMIES